MKLLVMAVMIAPAWVAPAWGAAYDVAEKDIATLQSDMSAGRVTALGLVQAYEARIAKLDPTLHSVIALNPDAENQARALDQERKAGHVRGALHDIPILVKDNIETLDPVATTAGSLALKDNFTKRDAPVIAHLRAAGVIVLGKANLSEWANIRSTHSISGWSAIGGLARNPFVLDRNTCGSSAGSGAAVAASLAAAALGTETDGSLVCPGSFNGIVAQTHSGPGVAHAYRAHLAHPGYSRTHDPQRGRCGAAVVGDGGKRSRRSRHGRRRCASRGLCRFDIGRALKGVRLGLILPPPDHSPSTTDVLLQHAADLLQAQGAEIVELHDFKAPENASNEEDTVLKYELKHDMAQYLQSLPENSSGAGPKTLADLIAFDAITPRELVLFDQDYFNMAEAKGDLDDPVYIEAHQDLQASTRALLDATLAANHLDALIRATDDPAFRTDVVKGDSESGSDFFLPATAGTPHLTVPMGVVQGLPVGISFMGGAWSEAKLLALGAAFERAAQARKPPTFTPSLESTPAIAAALAPLPSSREAIGHKSPH